MHDVALPVLGIVGLLGIVSFLPPLAVRWTKLSVNKWLKDVYNQVFDASIAFEHVTTASRDHREAAQAFLEKRPPKFTGH